MVDRYSKIILTIIAASLLMLALENFGPAALADVSERCGSASNPCWVQSAPNNPVYIQAATGHFYVATSPLGPPLEVKVVQ